MTAVRMRARATLAALKSLAFQFFLWIDQGCNAIGLGLAGVFMAAATGEEQAVAWADETLSAHAWRGAAARKPWARIFRPLVDRLFSWQPRNPVVDQAAGFPVEGHCERAFWKKRLRLGLPPEYREQPSPKQQE